MTAPGSSGQERKAYPVNLVLDGRRCLIVGGGDVARRKADGLLACGGRVHVVAPRIGEAIRSDPQLTWDERPYQSSDLEECWLVIAATDRSDVNRSVFLDGEAAGIWVNGADDPQHCSFTLPSVVRRGDLMLTVSTGGRSPAVATWIRQRLEDEIGPEYEVLLDLVSTRRQAIKAGGGSTEDVDWHSALDSDVLGLIRAGDLAEARERIESCR
ncbi:MAG TPA: bifunctional precorrin-2 dehydrogenase/sirohydrochlorin ferrochelatase [Acidimicrobiales bacterium]|nr:bifunctional precorrin-2 dehydrogenase/sirohydrochlorin ferrochelatase [Acidimicrobiales bacterium]